jgi:hypothetical protein
VFQACYSVARGAAGRARSTQHGTQFSWQSYPQALCIMRVVESLRTVPVRCIGWAHGNNTPVSFLLLSLFYPIPISYMPQVLFLFPHLALPLIPTRSGRAEGSLDLRPGSSLRPSPLAHAQDDTRRLVLCTLSLFSLRIFFYSPRSW